MGDEGARVQTQDDDTVVMLDDQGMRGQWQMLGSRVMLYVLLNAVGGGVDEIASEQWENKKRNDSESDDNVHRAGAATERVALVHGTLDQTSLHCCQELLQSFLMTYIVC